MFKEMRPSIDYKAEANRATTLRKKEKIYNNSVTGVDVKKDVEAFGKNLDGENIPKDCKDEVDDLVEKLQNFHNNGE